MHASTLMRRRRSQHSSVSTVVFSLGALLLLLALVSTASPLPYKNACGGSTVLKGNPGESCNPGSASQCDRGLVICHGTETLACIPHCDVEKISSSSAPSLPSPSPTPPTFQENEQEELLVVVPTPKVEENSATTTTTAVVTRREEQHSTDDSTLTEVCLEAQLKWCGRDGYFSFEDRRCHCSTNFFGDSCQHYDVCYSMECGDHGVCVQEQGEGSCRCEQGYGGPQCRTRLICQPGGVWRDDGCECNFGYTGRHCELCEKDIICVPTQKNQKHSFFALRVSGTLREQLLTSASLLGFDTSPILPGTVDRQGVLYGCDCKLAMRPAAVESEELLPPAPTEETAQQAAGLLRENYFFLLDDSDVYYRRHSNQEEQHISSDLYMSAFFDYRQARAAQSAFYFNIIICALAFVLGFMISRFCAGRGAATSGDHHSDRKKKTDLEFSETSPTRRQHRQASSLPLSMHIPLTAPTSSQSHQFTTPQHHNSGFQTTTSRRSPISRQ